MSIQHGKHRGAGSAQHLPLQGGLLGGGSRARTAPLALATSFLRATALLALLGGCSDGGIMTGNPGIANSQGVPGAGGPTGTAGTPTAGGGGAGSTLGGTVTGTVDPVPGGETIDPVPGEATEPLDSGRVTMRRLNRIEYDNTVRDLLGTTQQPGRDFLNDAPQFAFDNNADQLTLSPTQIEMYQNAAELLAAEAVTGSGRANLITCDLATGDACLAAIVSSFGSRAYRRPLVDAEVQAFLNLAAEARALGADDDEVLSSVIEAFLVSPHFLFRVEIDPLPTSAEIHPVGPYEMASRLSYLIYRSMPDQPLFDAAAAQALSEPSQLQAQAARMLAAPQGATFARDFVGQWLGTRLLKTMQFDPELFPSFTPELADSMRGEVEAFFAEFVNENMPVQELITADFSYVDGTLSRFYGVPDPGAPGLIRAVLNTPERGNGLLSMAGALAVTSYPTRTSVVKRGHWVLEHMLCAEPPPPPPDVEDFPNEPITASTQRELLELHRSVPACNTCHVMMDNIGLALENYDAIGAWRTMDAGQPIDARGEFPTGATFDGPTELASVLSQDPAFAACLAEHMLSYALGRATTASDEPYIETIASHGAVAGSVGVRDLLMNIVASEPFRLRRGEPEDLVGE